MGGKHQVAAQEGNARKVRRAFYWRWPCAFERVSERLFRFDDDLNFAMDYWRLRTFDRSRTEAFAKLKSKVPAARRLRLARIVDGERLRLLRCLKSGRVADALLGRSPLFQRFEVMNSFRYCASVLTSSFSIGAREKKATPRFTVRQSTPRFSCPTSLQRACSQDSSLLNHCCSLLRFTVELELTFLTSGKRLLRASVVAAVFSTA